MVIDTRPKWNFEIYGHFCGFLEDKIINFGPIDFQISLPSNINVNDGQNKFEDHISKTMAKIASFQPKIGQDATFAPTLNGHKSAIFYPILLVETNRIVLKAKLYLIPSSFRFLTQSDSEASHGQYCAHGPRNNYQVSCLSKTVGEDRS